MRKVRSKARIDIYKEDEEELECPNTLLVLDDCVDSGVIQFKGAVDKIAERGRHIRLSTIISSQRLSAISRSVRLNSDYFIMFSPYSVSELEQFLEQFVSKKDVKELRVKISAVFEKPFWFIVLDNAEKDVTKKLKKSNANKFLKEISLIN